ncbi:MAG: site-2 protease family protein [Pseudomonadota bacterium]
MHVTIIQTFTIYILPILFAITLHEAAHGYIALKLGDKTALMLGRVTLNPLKHIDPLGTVIVPILMFLLSYSLTSVPFIFGWAKPVPVTWQNLKHPRRDMALVALAGPVANLLMLLLWAALAKIAMLTANSMPYSLAELIILMGRAGIIFNAIIMILNLLPIPPLDGSRVISSILPPRWSYYYSLLEPYGFFIILIMIPTGILFAIMRPMLSLVLQLVQLIFGNI